MNNGAERVAELHGGLARETAIIRTRGHGEIVNESEQGDGLPALIPYPFTDHSEFGLRCHCRRRVLSAGRSPSRQDAPCHASPSRPEPPAFGSPFWSRPPSRRLNPYR